MNHLSERSSTQVSRRTALGLLSALGGLGLADLLRLRAHAALPGEQKSDTAVIFIFLHGGASQLETYDLKPEAPSEIRGEFKPIGTVVPGLDICELLPLHAKVADRFALLRSVTHGCVDHSVARNRIVSGRDPKDPKKMIADDYPAVGSIVAKVREDRVLGIPNYISCIEDEHDPEVTIKGSTIGAAYLGRAMLPFVVAGDPSLPEFKMQNLSLAPEMASRLDDRMKLLHSIDHLPRKLDKSIEATDVFYQRAFDLLTSDRARNAFDLSKEEPRVRDRYGHHAFGQRALLARRLVEAGSSFVNVVFENPTPGKPRPKGAIQNWDCHAVAGHIFDDSRFRLPYYDQAISALIEDIYSRGLDKKVMVIVTGEFGRTPRLESDSSKSGRPGRGHWPSAMTMLVSGGGIRTGQVVGSTNRYAEVPQDRPLSPNDVWATAYRHLGIDYKKALPDFSGRPLPILPNGEPIRELI
jgi:hypothetical protein